MENRAVLHSLQHVANMLYHGNIVTYTEQHITTTCCSNKCCLVYDGLNAPTLSQGVSIATLRQSYLYQASKRCHTHAGLLVTAEFMWWQRLLALLTFTPLIKSATPLFIASSSPPTLYLTGHKFDPMKQAATSTHQSAPSLEKTEET